MIDRHPYETPRARSHAVTRTARGLAHLRTAGHPSPRTARARGGFGLAHVVATVAPPALLESEPA